MKKIKIHGIVKVGTKGQIVIPKSARDTNNIYTGDELIVMGKEDEVIMLVKLDSFDDIRNIFESLSQTIKDKDSKK